MKPDRNTLIKVTLAIGAILILLGSFFRISHYPGGITLQILGFISVAFYTILLIKQKNKTTLP
jgi:hypothetical protein